MSAIFAKSKTSATQKGWRTRMLLGKKELGECLVIVHEVIGRIIFE